MTDMQLWRHRYNTVMKLIFISSSLAICYYMRVHKVVRQTYDRNEDTFREWFLVAPCALLAILLPQQRTHVEVRLDSAPGIQPKHPPPLRSSSLPRCPAAELCVLHDLCAEHQICHIICCV